jgi:hypothetical protein
MVAAMPPKTLENLQHSINVIPKDEITQCIKSYWLTKASQLRADIAKYNSTELSPSWEAANCAATQEFLNVLRNFKIHYRVDKSTF